MKKYIVISGAPGVGKSTILRSIRVKRPEFKFSVSWTSRAPRPEESEEDYHFVSASRFREAIQGGVFLEWVKTGDVYYGTPKPAQEDAVRILFDVDTHGGLAIHGAYPRDTLRIFITAPKEEICRRLTEREAARMDPAVLQGRIDRIDTETETALAHYDHIVQNEDDVEACVEQILRIIDTN